MGGVREWFGPIPIEAHEPVFHHRWEARVFVSLLMTNAMLGISYAAFRWAEERVPKAQYLAGYYQIWLGALEQLLIDHGVLAPGELDARLAGEQPTVRGQHGAGSLRRALTRRFVRTGAGPPPQWMIRLYPRLQGIHLRKLAPPQFAIGDRVAVSAPPTAPPAIHTRRPRYTWGKRGCGRQLPLCDGAPRAQRIRRARTRRALLHSRVRRQGAVGRRRRAGHGGPH